MKTNITLKLDIRLLQDARLLAAAEGKSVSGLLTAILEDMVLRRRDFQKARKRALQRLRTASPLGWVPPGSRDELHER